MRGLRKTLLDIFFPRFCLRCKREGRYLCPDCTLFLLETSFICPECFKGSFSGKTHQKCKKEKGLDGLVSVWESQGVARDLILKAKEESLLDVPEEVVEYAFLTIKENQKGFSEFLSFFYKEDTVISYIPVRRERKKKTGFDFSAVLAEKMSRFTKKRKEDLLKREKETLLQKDLEKEEREENVRGAFLPKKEAKRVVLVDDLWTSGATMKEAAKVLKEGGAEEVWGFVLTRVE